MPHTSSIEDYQLFQTTREEYVVRRVRNEMVAAGIPVEFSKGEAGRGQHEVNVTYAEALEAADRHLVFKNGVKEIAAQEGRAATFMAKWSMDEVGSSCHLHTSLWDLATDEPLMADRRPPSGSPTWVPFCGRPDPRRSSARVVLRPVSQLVPALRPRELGAHRRRVGGGQSHLRVPGHRPRCVPAGGEPGARG